MHKFEKLKVWQKSVELIKINYNLCQQIPKSENRNLIDQLIRASTSVSLNIAEGTGAENDKEFTRYLNVARKSLFEVIAILKIISHLYKTKIDFEVAKAEEVLKLLNGLKKYLSVSKLSKV